MTFKYNQKHFLQSSSWANFQEALNKEVLIAKGDGWSYQAIINQYRYMTELYVPYGPWAQDQGKLSSALKDLIELGQSKKASYIRIEPNAALVSSDIFRKIENSFKCIITKSPRQVQPNYTSIIDLSVSEEQIVANMNPSTRNLHRNFYKKGFIFYESLDYKDINYIVEMLKNTKTNQAIFHSLDYMTRQAKNLMESGGAKIFFIKDDKGEIFSGSMIFTSKDTWYLAHASSSSRGKSLHLNQPLISSIIIQAKQANAKYFDLYGVADPDDPKDRLLHISKFKQQFGGDMQHISTTYDIVLDKNKYGLYKLILRLSAIKRRIFFLLRN